MIVSLVVATALNGGIGKGGRMPWHLPGDLRHFKGLTLGKPVIMGRKTLESIGRPLPERRNIVLTRDQDFRAAGVQVCHSLAEALVVAEPAAEVMIIGGGEIYKAAWPRADRIYLTRIAAQLEADTFFPEIRSGEWRETARADYEADAKNPYAYSFVTLERVK